MKILKVSGLLDSTLRRSLSTLTHDLERFHPDLQEMLRANGGIRRWEYGMMIYGLPSLSGKDVLDIGSGPSFLPTYLAHRLGARVSVLDLPEPYTIEVQVLRRRTRQYGVMLQAGDMRYMPFLECSFDVVLSISAIEHLSHSADHKTFPSRELFIEHTKRTLSEMYRVLRPGGWIYLTSEAYLPGLVDHDNWSGKLVQGDPYGAYPLDRVNEIIVSPLRDLGASFPYPMCFEPALLRRDPRYASYRHRFMTGFNLFAQKSTAT